MKKFLLGTLTLCFLLTACKKDEADNEIINFNDSNFKSILINNTQINTDGNSEISKAEAAAFTGSLRGENRNLTDVTGLEYFINVRSIALFNNNISSIDVSKNTKLTQLLLSNNNITSLDVSALTQLTDLKCHTNQLTEAIIANGNNANMNRMELQGNPNLTCVQVDALPAPTNGWLIDITANYNTSCN